MDYLRDGTLTPPPALSVQRDTILNHYEALLEYHGTQAGNAIARKHIGWYLQDLQGSDAIRTAVNASHDPAFVKTTLLRYFDGLMEGG
jgi:tRNA-dihydrouridine synthase B